MDYLERNCCCRVYAVASFPTGSVALDSARRGSLLYRLGSVAGKLSGHRLVNKKVLPAEFRVR
jgi:hypothetical protein